MLDLICSESSTRFWRAGYANVILFIAPIFAILAWKLLIEIGAPTEIAIIIGVAVVLAFLAHYTTFVSRITEREDSIEALKAVTKIRIPTDSIALIRISKIGASQSVKITINRRDSARSVRLRLIAPTTNLGTFKSTVTALEEFARRHSG